jgi:uncharacterized protein (DUF2132 family)
MNNEIYYKNNPLHGVGLRDLLIELIDHYGFGILFAYLNINCFNTNPSLASSVKFLKKTDWARERVESFYLYQFKSLPRASAAQFSLPPRDRVIPEGQVPGEPATLSLEDAERLREKRAIKAAEHGSGAGHRSRSGKDYGTQAGRHSNRREDDHDRQREDEPWGSPNSSNDGDVDPWANWKSRFEQNKRSTK